MDGLYMFLVLLSGVVSSRQTSGSTLEVTVNSGDNVTVHCDCKLDTGVYIVWYRNCSHVNQPTLVLKTRLGSMAGPTTEAQDAQKIFHRYHIVKNNTSDTYDLLIRNVSDCDEGFYYCGTEERDVMSSKYQNLYGNITTRLILNSYQEPSSTAPPHSIPAVPWIMVFTSAFVILSTIISFGLFFYLWWKREDEPQILPKWKQDEDRCLTRVVFSLKDGPTKRQRMDHNSTTES